MDCNFVDVIQSKRKYLADGNDNIADQARKRSAVQIGERRVGKEC